MLINTPNNPSGAVYSAETLDRLAGILRAKQAEYGHDIFLISDEPYREIVFDGGTQPYPAKFYDNTLTCYSWSKSLSLPGERIGYVAVNPQATDAELIVPMCGQISRGTGHNCPIKQAYGVIKPRKVNLTVEGAAVEAVRCDIRTYYAVLATITYDSGDVVYVSALTKLASINDVVNLVESVSLS